MSFKLKFLTALAVLNLLLLLAGGVGSTGTLAIGTGTVCGISAGTAPNSVYCTNISQSSSATPYQILPMVSFNSVSAGTDFICGMRSTSTVLLCWNGSSSRVKRVHKGPSILSNLAVGETQISAIDNSGNQILWWRRHQNFPESIPGKYNSLTSGKNFTCGIDTNHNVACWGPLGGGIQSDFINHSMQSIVAGDSHMCGLDTSGFLICKGSNSSSQSYVPTGTAFEFTTLALGSSHTCALKQPNGTVICWGGTNGSGTGTGTYAPTNSTEFEFLVAGSNLTCGLTTNDYTVLCWASERGNISVFRLHLPKILPGICVKSESDCSCGTYPDSDSLCTGTGVICKRCNSGTRIILPVPVTNSSRLKVYTSTKIWYITFYIVAIIGIIIGLCTTFYCLRSIIRQRRENNLVLPLAVPSEINNNINGPSSSGSNGGNMHPSNPVLLQSASAPRSSVLYRQRSGPSSFKEQVEEFTFKQLEKATNFFSLDTKIGSGSFGTVYRARLPDGRDLAVKRGESSTRNTTQGEKENAFRAELWFLSRLRHDNLVDLVGFCIERGEKLLVYQYMKNGSLFNHLHPKDTNFISPVVSSWKMRIKLLVEAARAVEYLHNCAIPPIIHRDIKSSNILLDANWVSRVSDFGLSLMQPGSDTANLSIKAAGTIGYIDPELYTKQKLSVKNDVYSFGVVMLEVITGKKALFRLERGDLDPISLVEYAVPKIKSGELNLILDKRVKLEGEFSNEALELVAGTAIKCVKFEGKERPFMAEVVADLETAFVL